MFNQNDVLLFQGDSITDCKRTRDDLDSCGHGYAVLLKSKFLHEHAGKDLKIYNKAISGNRIVDMYARFEEDCYNLQPNILSILIGVNDVWHEFTRRAGINAEKFNEVYDLLLVEAKKRLPGVKLVLMEPFFLAGGLPVGEYSVWRKEMDVRSEIVKTLADKHGAIFVPLQKVFDEACTKAPDTYWLHDGVHPTAAGHMVIAQQWEKVVMQNM